MPQRRRRCKVQRTVNNMRTVASSVIVEIAYMYAGVLAAVAHNNDKTMQNHRDNYFVVISGIFSLTRNVRAREKAQS